MSWRREKHRPTGPQCLAADPIYLAVDRMEDVVRCEAQRTLGSPAVRRDLASWRNAPASPTSRSET
jgi:hypothetical protein